MVITFQIRYLKKQQQQQKIKSKKLMFKSKRNGKKNSNQLQSMKHLLQWYVLLVCICGGQPIFGLNLFFSFLPLGLHFQSFGFHDDDDDDHVVFEVDDDDDDDGKRGIFWFLFRLPIMHTVKKKGRIENQTTTMKQKKKKRTNEKKKSFESIVWCSTWYDIAIVIVVVVVVIVTDGLRFFLCIIWPW